MSTMRDYSFLQPSKKAKHNYRRLKQANTVVYALLGLIVVLGIWNVLVLSTTISSDSATDLADIASIRDNISSQLIIWTSLITLAIFIFKEWKWGERSFAMVYFLAPLLFLSLVPAMSAEVEPAEESMAVKLTLNYCEPGEIENGTITDNPACQLVDPADTTVFMTHEDPETGDPEWLEPNSSDDFGSNWQVEARGKFRVYFLLQQESMEQCTSSTITTSVNALERPEHLCIERDGKAWLVQPYETSAMEAGRLTLYQEVAP